MKIREATDADVPGMSAVLQAIVTKTGRVRPTSEDYVRLNYLNHPCSVQCLVAVSNFDHVVGFQSLLRTDEANPWGLPAGWGAIGTHIHPGCHRTGVGSQLFAGSLAAAAGAGLMKIDATIGDQNRAALGYYEAMGFRTWSRGAGTVSKVFRLELEGAA